MAKQLKNALLPMLVTKRESVCMGFRGKLAPHLSVPPAPRAGTSHFVRCGFYVVWELVHDRDHFTYLHEAKYSCLTQEQNSCVVIVASGSDAPERGPELL